MKKLLLFLICPLSTISIIYGSGGGDAPIAMYSYYIEYVGYGSEVYFLNESTDGETYSWDFGDGATSTELNPVHAYPEPGIFIVCLTATNDFGSDTFCDTLNTYYPPSADFTFSGDPLVIFTDLSTNYPDSWDWFFGDGGYSALQNPEYIYAANGDYNVCLSVGNPGGTSYACKTVTISSYPVTVAGFSYAGDPEVSFTDLSSESPYAWAWDFGDGAVSTEQNPSHTYDDNDIFNVCLTATNVGGTDTYCEEINIIHGIAPPAAAFSYFVIGAEAAFVDESTNAPFEWFWDFGDGNNSAEQNPVHVYAAGGNYHVCLTATNEGGSDTACEDLVLTTGIEEVQQQTMTCFPNPVDASLIIQLPEFIRHAEIVLFDEQGRVVYKQLQLSGASVELDMTAYPSGNYHVVCYDHWQKQYTVAIVKQ